MNTGSEYLNNRPQKIYIVIDPSHSDWVLGGLFRELASSSPCYFEQNLVTISAPRNLRTIFSWLKTCLKIRRLDFVIFSSLTPLENYVKFPLNKNSQSISLWFTHKELSFSRRGQKALRNATHIFLHSKRDIEVIKEVTDADCSVLVGAIDPIRFTPISEIGSDIAWIGTPSSRKRPELFFEVAKNLPNTGFRLIGPGWRESRFWSLISESPNIHFVELNQAITSRDLDGCSIILVTSSIEGGPMSLLEGIASGLFPITTDVGFAKDILKLSNVPEDFIVEPESSAIVSAIHSAQQRMKSGFYPNREEILNLTFEKMGEKIHAKISTSEVRSKKG